MVEKKIRGGSLIAQAIKDKGIENVFTLSGGFCYPALEGFMEYQMNVINCPPHNYLLNLNCVFA